MVEATDHYPLGENQISHPSPVAECILATRSPGAKAASKVKYRQRGAGHRMASSTAIAWQRRSNSPGAGRADRFRDDSTLAPSHPAHVRSKILRPGS
jgi:hypothetical protein